MHLLKLGDDDGIFLVQDFGDDNTPPYAILSHTWGSPKDEVTFDDIVNGRGKSKAGYQKIRFCAEQARRENVEYCWVDTCCINNFRLAELSESITSMFRWYQQAAKCYVYLDDIATKERWKSHFRGCKWFTRGWTLQELLAPNSVQFFSRDGQLLGSKHTLSLLLQEITGIPTSALEGTTPLSEFSPRVKMQWASSRHTTRPEDKIYCLQGIFNIYLLPNYGERNYALTRFKREVAASYESQVAEFGPLLTESNIPSSSSAPDIREQETSFRDWCGALGFDQMHSRQATIKSAYSSTCAWLLRSSAYRDWMDPTKLEEFCRFLWIKGKPGVGKSTLMKYALARAKALKNGEIVISFFFNARGGALERSTLGMYRALLFQLLHKAEKLSRASLLRTALNECLTLNHEALLSKWNIDSLRELLTSVVRSLRQHRVRCFIDALDECDEQEVRDMVIHLENLGQISEGRNFHVCFASRHYPSIVLRCGMQLIVENEPGHNNDLTKYVKDHLRIGQERTKTATISTIQAQIETKANGVFMWAVLVVNILNQELSNGKAYAVQKRLDELPAELSLLFRDMLHRDNANMDDLLLCMQWILFAREPLTPKEFYYAMLSGLEPNFAAVDWDPDSLSDDDLDRFVVASSKGLAQTTTSRVLDTASTVQFIHESVKDFLVKDGGLYELWPELKTGYRGQSHDRLRSCCQNYLTIDLGKHLLSVRELLNIASPDNRLVAVNVFKTLTKKLPFLAYAATYAFYHANEAMESVSQVSLLSSSCLQNWNLASLLVSGDRHLPFIVDTYALDEVLHCIVAQHIPLLELYNYALYEAAREGHSRLVTKLLDLGADANARGRGNWKNALNIALHERHHEVATLLIDAGADVNADGDLYIASWTQLADIPWGAFKRIPSRVKFPLVPEDEYGNALHAASANGDLEAVKLLLDAGADVNACARGDPCNDDQHYALLTEIIPETKLTELHVDVDTNACGGWYSYALQAASYYGHQEIVKRLLSAGADVNAQAGHYGSALHVASSKGYHGIVKLLIAAGADVHAKGGIHRNALRAALYRSHVQAVQVLLDAGGNTFAPEEIYMASQLGVQPQQGTR